MDVLVLIDRLDDLLHNAKAVPLTDRVRIDREEIFDILDQMRATIPDEVKQARWIVKERQEMLGEAKREVDRLLADAREQAVREASRPRSKGSPSGRPKISSTKRAAPRGTRSLRWTTGPTVSSRPSIPTSTGSSRRQGAAAKACKSAPTKESSQAWVT